MKLAWLADRVLLKIVYVLVRPATQPRCPDVSLRLSEGCWLLVLRHENAVLRHHTGRVGSARADRVWFAALARLIPRSRWPEISP